MHAWLFLALAPYSLAAFAQTRSMSQGPHRMEIQLQKMDAGSWKLVDPGLVFEQNDRVRFRFQTNFDGYLYVMNRSTSGKYEQLFPRSETGEDNKIAAGREYNVPATQTVFRIGGPAGQEIIFWVVSPIELAGGAPKYVPLPPPPPKSERLPADMTPRCDDSIFKTRGECVDSSAGPRKVPQNERLPGKLAEGMRSRDLVFMRNQGKSVVASPVPLTGPVIYEFRLAHK